MDLLTDEQLAEAWSTSPRHIRRLRTEAGLPYIKLGRLVRFDQAACDAWARSRTVAPPPARVARRGRAGR